MVNVDAKFSGDFDAALNSFDAKAKDSIIFSGVAAAARVMYDELKLNTSGARMKKAERNFVGPNRPSAPGTKTKNLHDAIYRFYVAGKSSDGVKVYHVGVNKKEAPHWHLIEYGHFQPYQAVLTDKYGWITRKKSKHTKQFIPPHPYIRPAISKLPDAIAAAKRRMAERLAGGK